AHPAPAPAPPAPAAAPAGPHHAAGHADAARLTRRGTRSHTGRPGAGRAPCLESACLSRAPPPLRRRCPRRPDRPPGSDDLPAPPRGAHHDRDRRHHRRRPERSGRRHRSPGPARGRRVLRGRRGLPHASGHARHRPRHRRGLTWQNRPRPACATAPAGSSEGGAVTQASTADFVVVANRLPVDLETAPDGSTRWRRAPGGLVTALEPILRHNAGAWVGWPGISDIEVDPLVEDGLQLHPVTLDADDFEGYYEGFSNATLWPLYHDLVVKPAYHRHWWQSYQQVNPSSPRPPRRSPRPGRPCGCRTISSSSSRRCCAACAPI